MANGEHLEGRCGGDPTVLGRGVVSGYCSDGGGGGAYVGRCGPFSEWCDIIRSFTDNRTTHAHIRFVFAVFAQFCVACT